MKTRATQPILIGIQGGTCAGKTELTRGLASSLGEKSLMISLDKFYLPYVRSSDLTELRSCYFDDPSAIDWALLSEVWSNLRQQTSAPIPTYDYVTGLRGPAQWVPPKEFIILEGLWAFHDTDIFGSLNLTIYVDTPPDVRLLRRLHRDVIGGERGWDLVSSLAYYSGCQRPMHEQFVEPGRTRADVVVDGEQAIHQSVEVVLTAMRGKLLI